MIVNLDEVCSALDGTVINAPPEKLNSISGINCIPLLATAGKLHILSAVATDGTSRVTDIHQIEHWSWLENVGLAGIIVHTNIWARIKDTFKDGPSYIILTHSLPVDVAIERLAHWNRRRCSNTIFIGITGSNGKTTVTKMLTELLKSVECPKTVVGYERSRGLANGQIGVPYFLLGVEPHHKVAVVEMGLSDFGHMSRLSNLVKPDITLVLCAKLAHVQNTLHSVKDVAKAKMEIVKHIHENGTVIINGDDPNLVRFARVALEAHQTVKKVFVARKQGNRAPGQSVLSPDKTVLFRDMQGDYSSDGYKLPGVSVLLDDSKWHNIQLSTLGQHNGINGAFALSGAQEYLAMRAVRTKTAASNNNKRNIPIICNALSNVTNADYRLVRQQAGPYTFVLDSYNANADSTIAAIQVLVQKKKSNSRQQKWIVFRGMKGLGAHERVSYERVSSYLKQQMDSGLVDGLIVSKSKHSAFQHLNQSKVFYYDKGSGQKQQIVRCIVQNVPRGAVILIKGSNSLHASIELCYLTEAASAPRHAVRVAIIANKISNESIVSVFSAQQLKRDISCRNVHSTIISYDPLDYLSLVRSVQSYKPHAILLATHGLFGEDGAVHYALRCLGIPILGPSYRVARLCNDKYLLSKHIETHRYPDIRAPQSLLYHVSQAVPPSVRELLKTFKTEKIFIKPRSDGSSLGSQVVNLKSVTDSKLKTFLHNVAVQADDGWVIINPFVEGKEYTVALMDSRVVGMFIINHPTSQFWTKKNRMIPSIPNMSMQTRVSRSISNFAQKLGLVGMSRIDVIHNLATDSLVVIDVNPSAGMRKRGAWKRCVQLNGNDPIRMIYNRIAQAVSSFSLSHTSTAMFTTQLENLIIGLSARGMKNDDLFDFGDMPFMPFLENDDQTDPPPVDPPPDVDPPSVDPSLSADALNLLQRNIIVGTIFSQNKEFQVQIQMIYAEILLREKDPDNFEAFVAVQMLAASAKSLLGTFVTEKKLYIADLEQLAKQESDSNFLAWIAHHHAMIVIAGKMECILSSINIELNCREKMKHVENILTVYQHLLKRSADHTGLDHYTDMLVNHRWTMQDVVQDIQQSEEYHLILFKDCLASQETITE